MTDCFENLKLAGWIGGRKQDKLNLVAQCFNSLLQLFKVLLLRVLTWNGRLIIPVRLTLPQHVVDGNQQAMGNCKNGAFVSASCSDATIDGCKIGGFAAHGCICHLHSSCRATNDYSVAFCQSSVCPHSHDYQDRLLPIYIDERHWESDSYQPRLRLKAVLHFGERYQELYQAVPLPVARRRTDSWWHQILALVRPVAIVAQSTAQYAHQIV